MLTFKLPIGAIDADGRTGEGIDESGKPWLVRAFDEPRPCSACGEPIAHGWLGLRRDEPDLFVCLEHVDVKVKAPRFICGCGMDEATLRTISVCTWTTDGGR